MKKIILCSICILNIACAEPLAGHVETELRFNKIEHMGIRAHVESAHRATVTNNTTAFKQVIVHYRLCINTVCNDKKKYKITIRPMSTWSDGLTLDMNPYLLNPMGYAVYADTKVTNDKGFELYNHQYGEIQVKQ